jgi:hypothetical protein
LDLQVLVILARQADHLGQVVLCLQYLLDLQLFLVNHLPQEIHEGLMVQKDQWHP